MAVTGFEPAISEIINTRKVPLTEAAVNCHRCVNSDYFNDRSRNTSSYVQCPLQKSNKCKNDHQIICGTPWNERTDSDGECRCDSSKGYVPSARKFDSNGCFAIHDLCTFKTCSEGHELSRMSKCLTFLVFPSFLDCLLLFPSFLKSVLVFQDFQKTVENIYNNYKS